MKFLSLSTLAVALSFTQSVIGADWSVLDIPEASRSEICNRQTAFCTINCGGVDQAPMNFCNPKTMGWGCGCKTKVPDQIAYLWPVVVAECEGKLGDCNAKCPKDNTVNQCYSACTTKFQCKTPNSPPSYLNVSDVNATPLYTAAAPAATGSATGSTSGAQSTQTGTGSGSTSQGNKPNAGSINAAGWGSSAIVLAALSYMAL
ncbi:hypothetical protein K493DRAFT_280754 [Basidiobolus meristosporus CBS 931.73]|uniref:DUF7707 domain-containing protein n=1 Tax=Basidiobolus meristosporus CBS 931.73 TaxID=1314790 RepID=A0A1Y1YJ83_9FUNG|nr:hypothetical protein K493DRAFT_321723 [Basidiobolus meristosporus CBS 931.73]ORX98042.1 hypothetical protein K493DRAFT_280754 [Basidiobolus meristosporus CBS 931.73]|eukprot:ORX75291.1 hypothetical protein K493DRAFT_321723 [Basidiobolus meristosporus CBS 931.73]